MSFISSQSATKQGKTLFIRFSFFCLSISSAVMADLGESAVITLSFQYGISFTMRRMLYWNHKDTQWWMKN